MEALHLLWLHLLWLYLLWQVLHWGLNLTEAFGVSQVRPLALTLSTLTALTSLTSLTALTLTRTFAPARDDAV